MTDSSEAVYKRALRKYQEEVEEYERAARAYELHLQSLGEEDIQPSRPIPPIPPIRPIRLNFLEAEESKVGFNDGIEAASSALDSVGEKRLATWIRKLKRQ